MIRLVAFLAVVAGCQQATVVVRGRVMSNGGDKARGLPGATVEIRDPFGVPFDADETNERGRFRVTAPRGSRIYAIVSAEGYVPATFTGSSGFADRLEVDDGLLYGVREEEVDGWVDRFLGCPGLVPGDATFAIGQVREFNLVDPETGESPIVTTAQVRWQRADGLTSEACYLDAEGEAYDETAEVTGPSGWYLVPDVAPGVGTLVIAHTAIDPDETLTILYDAVMVPGGIHPRFPTWVDSPIGF